MWFDIIVAVVRVRRDRAGAGTIFVAAAGTSTVVAAIFTTVLDRFRNSEAERFCQVVAHVAYLLRHIGTLAHLLSDAFVAAETSLRGALDFAHIPPLWNVFLHCMKHF